MIGYYSCTMKSKPIWWTTLILTALLSSFASPLLIQPSSDWEPAIRTLYKVFPQPPPKKTADDLLLGIAGSTPLDAEAQCLHLFSKRSIYERDPIWPPPPIIPKSLMSLFSMNGSARVMKSPGVGKATKYNGGTGYQWSKAMVDNWKGQTRCGGYKKHDCYHRFLKYKHVFNKTRGIVIGSELPWAEAQSLRLGAAEVSTIEFMPIVSKVPHLHAFTPRQVADFYVASKQPSHVPNATDNLLFEVDFAISYSSLEHAGLGRYGDPIDPSGDLRAARFVHCMLRPGGVFFLALPTGPDTVVFNAHRVYGAARLPLMFNGFELIDVLGTVPNLVNRSAISAYEINYGVHQPIWVLKKVA